MSQSEEEYAVTAEPFPEGVTGYRRDGRKRYSPEFRRRVAAECRDSGASVASIGLHYGINANLVRRWMDQYAAAPEEATMLPVTLSTLGAPPMPASSPGASSQPDTGAPGAIVIQLGAGTVTVQGVVDRTMLAGVLGMMSQR